MFEIGDRIEVKHGKFQGCIGTIVDIDHCSFPPITIKPDDIRKFQGVFFYECDLKKIDKTPRQTDPNVLYFNYSKRKELIL